MELVLALLAISVVLGLTVKRVGLEVYAALFALASLLSLAFMFLYYRVFF